ncbi:hypothetical protein GCM10023310_35990 [Paenibacillus vulneris]|uniref:GNAT family N-acetyltransferase n=1 Tax=Paenibacillus vulneris TaxID=1133364 RepID=A0ABW3UPC4_9BACL|nr:GNAT family N-acetyltransferase [Paenibacillus sp. 32352]
MIQISQCDVQDYRRITDLYIELMKEIIGSSGGDLTAFDPSDAPECCKRLLSSGTYIVIKAEHQDKGELVGFLSMSPSSSLYANGSFGIIQELYICSEYRSQGVGRQLMAAAVAYANAMEWTRLEVSTPPLPAFVRSLAFYQREGFAVTGGEKLKLLLST